MGKAPRDRTLHGLCSGTAQSLVDGCSGCRRPRARGYGCDNTSIFEREVSQGRTCSARSDTVSQLAALVPYNNHSRVVAKKNKTLCLQIAEAYKPIIAFGKRAGCADACYDLLASAKDKADDVYQPQVTTSESTFYTAAEMRSMDSQDVMSRVWTSGSQKSAQAFLSALKKEWHELFKGMLSRRLGPDILTFSDRHAGTNRARISPRLLACRLRGAGCTRNSRRRLNCLTYSS